MLADVDGSLLVESEPIGRGNRWRNQLGVAPTGPDGELEIIDVRTPHIGGIVTFLQLDDDRLVVAADTAPYTSHVVGSRNLDMGVLADVTGDGRVEVVILSQDRSRLVAAYACGWRSRSRGRESVRRSSTGGPFRRRASIGAAHRRTRSARQAAATHPHGRTQRAPGRAMTPDCLVPAWPRTPPFLEIGRAHGGRTPQ